MLYVRYVTYDKCVLMNVLKNALLDSCIYYALSVRLKCVLKVHLLCMLHILLCSIAKIWHREKISNIAVFMFAKFPILKAYFFLKLRMHFFISFWVQIHVGQSFPYYTGNGWFQLMFSTARSSDWRQTVLINMSSTNFSASTPTTGNTCSVSVAMFFNSSMLTWSPTP